MNPGKIILTTVLTVFTLLAFAVVAATAVFPFGAQAHGTRGHFGGGDSNRHQRMAEHCQRLSPAHTRVVEAVITATLNLNDNQEAALQPVVAVLDSWRSATADACSGLPAESVDEGLATMQQFLNSTAQALSELRPAYAAFESELDQTQRAHIAEMLARHK